jgi:hypothetical protein
MAWDVRVASMETLTTNTGHRRQSPVSVSRRRRHAPARRDREDRQVSDDAPELSDRSGVTDAVRAQLLATEHWSLLATRTNAWNETFSRAAMFSTIVSAAVVALALVAQATDFGENFRLFAIPLLAVVLLVGLGTFARLSDAAASEIWIVAGMNRLRHAYLDLAPELEPYFVAGHHDDREGVLETWQPGGFRGRPSRFLASTPALVGAINAVVAGGLIGLLAAAAGATAANSAVAGVAAGLAAMILAAIAMQRARAQFWHAYHPRFPS